MSYNTPNLNLSLIAPNQAQKYITHNEALMKLDSLTHLSVISRSQDFTSDDLSEGDRFIVPTGEASGKANQVGQKDRDNLIYHTPQIGWTSWVEDEGSHITWNGLEWQLSRDGSDASILNEVSQLGLNAAADDENRLTVKSDNSLFTYDRGSHRLKINKSSSFDTASTIFQSGYQGYAEIGLTGDNNFHIRTSSNGTDFIDSFNIDAEHGSISMPRQPVIFGKLGLPTATPNRQVFQPEDETSSIMTNSDNTALVIPTDGVYMFSASQLVQISSTVYYWFLLINGATQYISQHNGASFNSQQHSNHIIYVQKLKAGDIIELTSSSKPLNAWGDKFSHFSLVKIA